MAELAQVAFLPPGQGRVFLLEFAAVAELKLPGQALPAQELLGPELVSQAEFLQPETESESLW